MRNVRSSILLVLVSYLVIGCGPPLKENAIRARIDSTVPMGTAKNNVIDFLNANSFNVIIDPEGISSPFEKDCGWVTASLGQKVLWREHYTVVDFCFDKKNDSLVEYRVRSFYSGPGT